jgi:hypothetical protein
MRWNYIVLGLVISVLVIAPAMAMAPGQDQRHIGQQGTKDWEARQLDQVRTALGKMGVQSNATAIILARPAGVEAMQPAPASMTPATPGGPQGIMLPPGMTLGPYGKVVPIASQPQPRSLSPP